MRRRQVLREPLRASIQAMMESKTTAPFTARALPTGLRRMLQIAHRISEAEEALLRAGAACYEVGQYNGKEGIWLLLRVGAQLRQLGRVGAAHLPSLEFGYEVWESLARRLRPFVAGNIVVTGWL